MTGSNPLPIVVPIDRVDVRAQKVMAQVLADIRAAAGAKNAVRLPVDVAVVQRHQLTTVLSELAPHFVARIEAVEAARSDGGDTAYTSGVMAGIEFARMVIDEMTEQ